MRPGRGKRVAFSAALGAAATVAAAAIVLQDPILETWYIHRLESADLEGKMSALRWLGAHGGERAFLATGDLSAQWLPAYLLMKDLGQDGSAYERMEPLARKRFVDIWTRYDHAMAIGAPLGEAGAKIRERLGKERIAAALRGVLAARSGSPRLRVYVARGAIVKCPEFDLGTEAVDLALRRLREALADPDPIVRAGAAYGIAGAGEKGRAALEAISALKADPDEVVREAAEHAIRKLASPAGGRPDRP